MVFDEFIRRSRLALPLILALWLCAAGCANPPTRPPDAPIHAIHMLTMPMALNLDTLPGADGFAVKIYAESRAQPKPVALDEGALEIVMYDGTFSGAPTKTPLRTWTFTAAELKSFETIASIGVGYGFTLEWKDHRPTEKRITVLARYLPPAGAPVSSAPSSLSVVSN